MKLSLLNLFLLVMIACLFAAWYSERVKRLATDAHSTARTRELEATYPYAILADFSIHRSFTLKHPFKDPSSVNNRLLVGSLMNVFWKRESIRKFKSLSFFDSPHLMAGKLLYELECESFEDFLRCFVDSGRDKYLEEYVDPSSESYQELKQFVETSLMEFGDTDKEIHDGMLDEHKNAG